MKHGIYIFFMLLIGYTSAFAQQTWTDAANNSVSFPHSIERIADAWPAHNAIVTMLGSGDKIVATIVTPQMCPWLYKINPHMQKATVAFSTDSGAMGSMEELLKAKPDVVFVSSGNRNRELFKNLGLNVFELSLIDFSSLKETVLLTGKVLGQKALMKAEAYATYLEEVTHSIETKLKPIPQNQKPKVLHLSGIGASYVADGSDSMMDAWIRLAGGINVASELKGSNKTVSIEQIVAWNPDIVIIGASSRSVQASDFLENPVFKTIAAVQTKKVYINPKGMFFWDRYSAEAILQVQWAAQIFYPEIFKTFDIEQETISFYTRFFDYPLSKEETRMIIQGIPPR